MGTVPNHPATPAEPIVVVRGLNFPEAPRWFEGALWFSDMRNGRVHTLSDSGELKTVLQLEDDVSGLGFLAAGRALVVSVHDRTIIEFGPGGSSVYSDVGVLLADRPQDFLNDMLVRADGSLYVGTRTPGLDPDQPGHPTDTLIYVPAPDAVDHEPRVAARALSGVNGLVEVGDRLVVSETYGRKLTSFRVSDDGTLDDRRTFAVLPGLYPDGICADREGGVWLGSAYSGEVVRVDRTGAITDSWMPSGGNAVACALGGQDGRTLFVCCANLASMRRTWSEETRSFSSVPTDTGTIQTVRIEVAAW